MKRFSCSLVSTFSVKLEEVAMEIVTSYTITLQLLLTTASMKRSHSFLLIQFIAATKWSMRILRIRRAHKSTGRLGLRKGIPMLSWR